VNAAKEFVVDREWFQLSKVSGGNQVTLWVPSHYETKGSKVYE